MLCSILQQNWHRRKNKRRNIKHGQKVASSGQRVRTNPDMSETLLSSSGTVPADGTGSTEDKIRWEDHK